MPGYLESRDPKPQAAMALGYEPKTGQPGSETCRSPRHVARRGGMTWMPHLHPELNLNLLGTGNPNPVHAGQGARAPIFGPAASLPLIPTRQVGLVLPAHAHDPRL